MRDALNVLTANNCSSINVGGNYNDCIFGTQRMLYFRDKLPRKREGVQSTLSLGRTIKYLRLRDAHHQMWRAKVFSRVERKQTPWREKSKSLGVAMTSDSGGGGIRPEIGGEIKDPTPARGYPYSCYICDHTYLHFIPGATSGPTQRVLREIVDRNRRCSTALRVPPPARRALAAE